MGGGAGSPATGGVVELIDETAGRNSGEAIEVVAGAVGGANLAAGTAPRAVAGAPDFPDCPPAIFSGIEPPISPGTAVPVVLKQE